MSMTSNMKVRGKSQIKDPSIILFGTKIPFPEAQMPPLHEFKGGFELVGGRERFSGDLELPAAIVRPSSKAFEAVKEEGTNMMKKPDKIIPCPRCDSLETKFCYFNNYNVNQPRHFCKNCQRYWTAGGTMRNVPIGAGRRKNKHLPSMNKLESPPPLSQPHDSSDPTSKMVLKFGHDEFGREEPSSVSSFCPKENENFDSAPRRPLRNPRWNRFNCSPENVTPPPVQVSLQFIPSSLWSCVPVWASGEEASSGNRCFFMGKRARDSISPSIDEQQENMLFSTKAQRVSKAEESVKGPFWSALGIQQD